MSCGANMSSAPPSAKAAWKKWKAEVAEAVEDGTPAPPRPPEADDLGPFVAPRFHVSDTTTEKLAVLLKARPRGMLVICDELSGVFCQHGALQQG